MSEDRYRDLMRVVCIHARNLVARRMLIREVLTEARFRECGQGYRVVSDDE